MIFVTIGTQEPFDRLVRAVDDFASNWSGERIVAQLGDGSYKPRNMETVKYLSPSEYDDLFNGSRLVISHAGTGTILSAIYKKIPILVLPRKASLGEHRNEHQQATANKFSQLGYITVAKDVDELKCILQRESYEGLRPRLDIGEFASERLLDDLRGYFEE